MDLTGFESQLLTKKPDHRFYSCLYLRQSSGDDQRTAETIHKTNLHICTFRRHIRSNHNSLPWCKTDHSNGFSCMVFSFMNTDEIFAVASAQPGKVNHTYLYGLMSMPYLGWAMGTLMGAVAGQLLPAFVRTALGIAIYGMFLAIILPPARKEHPVRVVVVAAVAMSLCFRYIPALSQVSSGFVIIICAVAASTLGALLFPVKEGDA